MPPYLVIFHRLAVAEARAASRWYARRSAAAATRFRMAVNDVTNRMSTAPDQGSPFGWRYRWMAVRRFPYVLYYEILDPYRVRVYAVAHTSRRPGYWLRRIIHP